MPDITSAKCFLCNVSVPEENLCGSCSDQVYFCSESHLKSHKGTIRKTKDKSEDTCWAIKVENKPVVGNILVTTRDIKATETILEEHPAALGHHAKSKPCCMECLGPVFNEDRCDHCNFPLCKTEKCQMKANHKAECSILATLKVKDFNMTENCLDLMCVLPIRVLNLKEVDSVMWQKVDLLMDHRETMKDDERLVWQTKVIDPILASGLRSWSADDILRAIGIINTNGVSLGAIKGCGLYPTFSYISHSCISNARFQVHHDKRIKVTALRDIPKGTEITISYCPSNAGNTLRRAKIKKNWYFDCQCERCCDPTELGSYVDAVKCQKCKEGYMLPERALDLEADWKCDNCPERVNAITMTTLIATCQEEINEFNDTKIELVVEKMNNWSNVLHKNHFLIGILRKRLFDLYRLYPAPETEVELRLFLQKQVEVGSDLLGVVEILEPGFSLKRGRILRQLHMPSLQLAKFNLKEKKISLPEFVKITKTVIKLMNEAIKCMEDFDLDSTGNGNAKDDQKNSSNGNVEDDSAGICSIED